MNPMAAEGKLLGILSPPTDLSTIYRELPPKSSDSGRQFLSPGALLAGAHLAYWARPPEPPPCITYVGHCCRLRAEEFGLARHAQRDPVAHLCRAALKEHARLPRRTYNLAGLGFQYPAKNERASGIEHAGKAIPKQIGDHRR